MHVIATAGHVDHGKSTLIRSLTGTDPDRLGEEHRRGLSITLGYCWTTLPGVGEVAFVDVPGHERFLSTTLSGLGPVPAVLFVVAADDPWMPQAAEHLAALDGLGVDHGVVVVTRADLADPAPAMARARTAIDATSLRGAPVLPVSGATGAGLPALREALAVLVRGLPDPDPGADVRLWVDRRFAVHGAGTVVTGTLPAGRVRVGDRLAYDGGTVRVRGLQALGADREEVGGVARVALSLGGDAPAGADRGHALVTPGAWWWTSTVDVRLRPTGSRGEAPPPQQPVLYVGATAVSTHLRPLGPGLARLRLARPLPLRIDDRALLRDPGNRRLWGVAVLDPDPPDLRRRGAARKRAAALAAWGGTTDPAAEVRHRGIASRDRLRRIGVPVPDGAAGTLPGVVESDGWLLDPDLATSLARRLADLVEAHDTADPLDPGLPVAVAARELGLPSAQLVTALAQPPLRLRDGRVRRDHHDTLPDPVATALDVLTADLADHPFAAPDAARLTELGLGPKELAAAERAGHVLRVGPTVLLPDAADTAVQRLRDLPQPFTSSQARTALDTTRRVAIPLLELLDRQHRTRRLPDDRRVVRS